MIVLESPSTGRSRIDVRAADVGTTLVASASVLIMLAVANVVIARMLGVRGQGTVAAATVVPMVIGYGGELGLAVATGYLINVHPDHRERILATARYLASAASVVLVVVTTAVILALPLGSDIQKLSILFCPFAALNLFYRIHLAILQADMRIRWFNAVRLAGAATYLGLVGAFALTGLASVTAVVAALLAANVVWCGVSWWLAGRRTAARLDRGTARAMLSYGWRAHLGNVSVLDALRIDQLVLALFLTARPLGLYVAAMTVVTGNRVIGTSMGAICFPLASRRTKGTEGLARTHFRRLLAVTVALSVVLAAVEVILGGRLLSVIFGPDYAAAGSVLRILAIGSVFMNLRQVYADWLRGCGRPGVVAVSEALGLVSLTVISIVLWDGTVEAVAAAVAAASVVAWSSLVIGATFFRGTVSNVKIDAVEPLPA